MLLVKDTKTRFGLVSVLLHWYITATILFLLPSGLLIDYIGPHGPLKPLREDMTWWHMSFAVTAIPFFLFRIFWRVRSGKPTTHHQHWTLHLAAEAVWRFLLVMIVWQIFSGPALELSHEVPVHWFGLVLIEPPLPDWLMWYARYAHDGHVYGAYTIGTLLALHVAGVLKHQLIDRDNVLKAMLYPVDPAARRGSAAAEKPQPAAAE
jgi:cytochrome b561